MESFEALLTVAELSAWLRVKESTIRKWVCYNRIPYLKVGRCVCFNKSDVDLWLLSSNPQRAKWHALAEAAKEPYNDRVR